MAEGSASRGTVLVKKRLVVWGRSASGRKEREIRRDGHWGGMM
eukprot:CAMPEP_0185435974 /NCGR_PEP_ID=MMETSP1365-20130426/26434_1 /TAXON_ID=38817 /ORGANISM="Gephyrocapsa oceanica, Strain RCC1303" /LENGTH=42 /DNA_ID= /DNA_START= /DNA_END= /DNA_ORIENTATION=